jgi:hypothetical protein
MPNITSRKMTVGARHRFSLEDAFGPKNWPAKRSINASYAIRRQIKNLPWSDPGPLLPLVKSE